MTLSLARSVVVLCLALWPGRVQADEPIHIVATTTDLASIAMLVGGRNVRVATIVPPALDAEDYEPKPSLLQTLKRAQLLIRVGLDYDAWLDRMLRQLPASDLRPGGTGHVDASAGVTLLEVHGAGVSPGHAHGLGNPHYWLDPGNGAVVAESICAALARLDPARTTQYIANRNAFSARLTSKLKQWQQRLEPFRDRALVAHHNNWPYFERRFQLRVVAIVESKPGVAPGPARLARLLAIMRRENARVILRLPQQPAATAELLARKANAKVLTLAGSVGAVDRATDYFGLFDYNIEQLAGALR